MRLFKKGSYSSKGTPKTLLGFVWSDEQSPFSIKINSRDMQKYQTLYERKDVSETGDCDRDYILLPSVGAITLIFLIAIATTLLT